MKTYYTGPRDIMPKRRKRKDNPYTIFSVGKDTESPRYFVEFFDQFNILQQEEVTKEVYDFFDREELHDISQMNEEDRHYEQSELMEETLIRRACTEQISLEEQVIKKESQEALLYALSQLTKEQRKRIVMYFFQEKTYEEIALAEGCFASSVLKSNQRALRQLKKYLKIFELGGQKIGF